MKVKLGLLAVLAIGIMFAIAVGCGQNGGSGGVSDHAPITYYGTQSPGDAWTWSVGNGTFEAANHTTGFIYSGTYVILANGFRKATINSTTDPYVPTGSEGYFLEFPNTLLLVGVEDSNLIACTAQATGEPVGGQYNWIMVPDQGWSPTDVSYGTVEVTKVGTEYSFAVRTYDVNGNYLGSMNYSGFIFSNGKLIHPTENLQVFMTPSGVYLGDEGDNAGGFAGVKFESIDIADLVTKHYRGVIALYDATSGDGGVMAIGAEPYPAVSNALRGFSYDDVDRNIRNTDTATLEFGAQDGSGVISATLTSSDGPASFRMVGARVNGKYMAFGISLDPSTNQPMSILVVEQ